MNKNICVFCGSRLGSTNQWSTWAKDLGQGIATRNWTLVFGGGGNGLMGQLAQGALHQQGRVIGITPHGLQTEQANMAQLTELHYVQTMSERKEMMSNMANAFVIIPGGIGTFDELFEVWATAQIGFHKKPIILANWSGYYDGLIHFLQQSVQHGLMSESHFEKIQIVQTVPETFSCLEKSLA